MACGACSKRRSGQGRVIPVNPRTKSPKSADSDAVAKGSELRNKLRYTGR